MWAAIVCNRVQEVAPAILLTNQMYALSPWSSVACGKFLASHAAMRGELCQHVRWLKCPAGSSTCEQTHGGPYLPAELVHEALCRVQYLIGSLVEDGVGKEAGQLGEDLLQHAEDRRRRRVERLARGAGPAIEPGGGEVPAASDCWVSEADSATPRESIASLPHGLVRAELRPPDAPGGGVRWQIDLGDHADAAQPRVLHHAPDVRAGICAHARSSCMVGAALCVSQMR